MSLDVRSGQIIRFADVDRKAGQVRGFLGGGSLRIISLLMAEVTTTSILFYDFYSLWAAGRIALDGGNVYDAATFSRYLLAAGVPAHEHMALISHPPQALIFYMPFALLPFKAAAWLWLVCSAIVAGFSVMVWCQLRRNPLFNLPERFLSPGQMLLTMALFPPLISTLVVGQNNIILLLGVTLFVRALAREKSVQAGMWLSLTLLKPHLFLAFYAYIGFMLLRRRSQAVRFVSGAACGTLVQCLLLLLVYPQGINNYLAVVPTMLEAPAWVGLSLRQVLFHLAGVSIASWIFMIAAFGAAVGFALQRGPLLSTALFRVLPVSLLTALHVWPHSLVILLPAYLEMVSRWFGEHERRATAAVVLIALLGILDLAIPLRFTPLFIILLVLVWMSAPDGQGRAQAERASHAP